MSNATDTIQAVCLDFDGTILAYETGRGVIPPDVIGLLNELGARGIEWWSNSGRIVRDQMSIVSEARRAGLRHPPTALMCGRSLLFERIDGAYHPVAEWNDAICEMLPVLHQQVQAALSPQLVESWTDRFHPEKIDFSECGTAFLVPNENEVPDALRTELAAALAEVSDAYVNVNGGWVFVQHRSLGKASVLHTYLERRRWKGEGVLAIGDNHNDLDMLDGRVTPWVGCPADAVLPVREAVAGIGGHVATRSGVAGTLEVIRHFICGS